MSYAAVSDIESEFRKMLFKAAGSNDPILSGEVQQFLDQTDQIINVHLSGIYQTPVTNAESVLVLKKIETDLVAYRIAKILSLKKSVPLPEKNIVQELNEGAAFVDSMRLLKKLGEGKLDLVNADKKSATSGLSSGNVTNNVSPVWKRDVAQW